jgi:hypothetical protein
MTTHSAIPATIGTLPRHTALAFLSLFFVPGVAQAILLTVVPLETLKLLGNARAVTLLYVGTGFVAVIGRFSIPYLVGLIRRRFVFTLGTLSLAISSIMLAFDGAGNLLFLRAIPTYERAEMTTVFVSFRDVAQLAPPTICSLLLSFFSVSSVVVAAGIMMLAAATVSGRIPCRL